jgi:hypothetical protein
MAVEILDRLTHPHGIQPWRLGPVSFGQHRGHFLDQAAADHLFGPLRDAAVQHRPRSAEQDVPWCNGRATARGPLPMTERMPAQERELDRASRTLPPAAAESGIKPGGPTHQLRGREPVEPCLQIAPPSRREGGLPEQTLGKRPNVEPGAAHHHR